MNTYTLDQDGNVVTQQPVDIDDLKNQIAIAEKNIAFNTANRDVAAAKLAAIAQQIPEKSDELTTIQAVADVIEANQTILETKKVNEVSL